MTEVPTWQQHVHTFFTQYAAIQMSWYFNLKSYDDVKKYSRQILLVVTPNPDPDLREKGYSSLENPKAKPGQPPFFPLMPEQEEKWSEERIAAFQAWIDAGCPYGAPAPERVRDPRSLGLFIDASQALTGFDDLGGDPQLAQTYVDRLVNEVTSGAQLLDALLSTWAGIRDRCKAQDDLAAAIQRKIMGNASLGPFAQTVIMLWYTGSIDNVFGTPENNQYIDGLMWRAIDAHPMGYATETGPFGYWQLKPKDGKNTGLAKS